MSVIEREDGSVSLTKKRSSKLPPLEAFSGSLVMSRMQKEAEGLRDVWADAIQLPEFRKILLELLSTFVPDVLGIVILEYYVLSCAECERVETPAHEALFPLWHCERCNSTICFLCQERHTLRYLCKLDRRHPVVFHNEKFFWCWWLPDGDEDERGAEGGALHRECLRDRAN